jgi:hypothetical protein
LEGDDRVDGALGNYTGGPFDPRRSAGATMAHQDHLNFKKPERQWR